MFGKETSPALCLTVAAAVLSILCAGCGSSSSNNMSNNSLSPAQTQAVTDQVVAALTQALTNTFSSDPFVVRNARPSLANVVGNIDPNASSGCTPAAGGGETCNFPISLMNDPCGPLPQGGTSGTISVTGDIDGTLNDSGTGSVSAQFTITPANCAVSNLVINGDPNIDLNGQINFANSAPTFPLTFTETGGISYGPNPSGSCQLNATYTINSSLSCTVSGTVCGQSVSGSC